jgi:hypothetical protein
MNDRIAHEKISLASATNYNVFVRGEAGKEMEEIGQVRVFNDQP